MTGRHPYRYGIRSANVDHLEQEEITLAEALRAQGYATGHFGKWHLGTLTTRVVDANRGRPGETEHYSTPAMAGFDVNILQASTREEFAYRACSSGRP